MKIFLRNLLRMRKRGIAIAVGVLFWTASHGGYFMLVQCFAHSFDTLCQTKATPNLQVTFRPVRADSLPNVAAIPGVSAAIERLVIHGSLFVPPHEGGSPGETRTLPAIVIAQDFEADPPINRLTVVDGALPLERSKEGAVRGVIDATSASLYGIGPSVDPISINVAGLDAEIRLTGVVRSPEFIFPTADPALVFPAKGSLAVLYISLADLERVQGPVERNNLAVRFAGGHDPEALERRIRSLLAPLDIEMFVPFHQSFDWKLRTASIDGAGAFAPITSGMLLVVVLVLLAANVHRMTEENTRAIGLLLALGMSPGRVVLDLWLAAMTFASVGGILGFGLAFPVGQVFTWNFNREIGLPALHFIYPMATCLDGLLISLGLSALVTVLVLLPIFSLSPSEALRGKPPLGEQVGAHRGANGILHRLRVGLLARYGIRALFRRPLLSGITIVSMTLALSLSVAFNILITSIDGTFRDFFRSEPRSATVAFRYPLATENIPKVLAHPGLRRVEGYATGLLEARFHGRNDQVYLLGLAPSSELKVIRPVEGRRFIADDALEAVVNRNVWKDDLNLGDTLEVGENDRRMALRVVGIVDEVLKGFRYAYVPLGTAQRLLGLEGRLTGAYCEVEGDLDGFSRDLYENESVGNVLTKTDNERQADRYRENLKAGLGPILGVVMLLAPIFLWAAMDLHLHEQRRDFVLMRALGSERSGVHQICIFQAFALGLTSLLISIPMAVGMGLFLNWRGGKVYYGIDLHVFPSDYEYAMTCLPPLLLIVAWLVARAMLRKDLAAELRTKAG